MTNFVLMVNRSHLERVVDFIQEAADANNNNLMTIVDTKKSTASKSCSLIFIHTNTDNNAASASLLESLLSQFKFLLLGLNKIYIMTSNKSIVRGRLAPFKESDVIAKKHHDGVDTISQHLYDVLLKLQTDNPSSSSSSSNRKPIKVKVDVYPAKLQKLVISNITALLDGNNIPESELDISPTDQDYNMSIIQIDSAEEINKNSSANNATDVSGTFFVGIATAAETIPPISNPINNPDDICRAYYKLSEAFTRYQPNGFTLKRTNWCDSSPTKRPKRPVIAIDCGAAPGGWTKFLIEQTYVDEVYSIDPGELNQSVSSLHSVHHMKMTAAKAIPQLRNTLSKNSISLWVSDMCIHDISKQVDTFLHAKKAQLFEPDAAFILTIKCNVGHAKECFDKIAKNEAARLAKEGDAYDIQIIHLFSNRIGERTIIGYIK